MNNNVYNKNNSIRPNPYSPQYPASPEYFANRAEILDQFEANVLGFTKLEKAKPTNFAVLGEWGVGKTSILYKFQQIASEELADRIACFSSLLSLNPECCSNITNFFSILLSQLKDEYRATARIRGKLKVELEKWRVSFKIPPIGVELNREQSVSYFSKDLETLWNKHLKPMGIEAAFIFLDDIHHFIPKQPGAFDSLRNIFQSLAMKGCRYSLIISGPKILFTYAADLAEPFTRFFHPFYLENFNLEATAEAIRRPLEVNNIPLRIEDDAIIEIQSKILGHPYFLLYTMQQLVNQLPNARIITKREFQSAWPKIFSTLEITKFKTDFDSASENERKILTEIARIEEEKVAPSMIKGVKGATMLFRRLEEKGLLIKSERGRYQLYHPLFREYLKRAP